jgi:hypothetical protein
VSAFVGSKRMHDSLDLCETNALVAYWQEHSDLPPSKLDAAIGAAIDALYESRDAGGNMHSSGAACAVAALEAATR